MRTLEQSKKELEEKRKKFEEEKSQFESLHITVRIITSQSEFGRKQVLF